MKVRLFKPSVGQEELDAVAGAIDRAWLGLGKKVGEFEDAWQDYIGSPHAVALNSGTAALHLAVTACDLPKGSKVLVPAMTFVSTATAVLYNGLEPVFIDCDTDTLTLDLEDAAAQGDLPAHAHVGTHVELGQHRGERGEDGDALRGAVLRDRALRQVHVHVDLLEEVVLEPELLCARADVGEGRGD